MSKHISDSAPGCDGYAVVNEDGTVESCHPTREAAQMHVDNHDDNSDDSNKFWSGVFTKAKKKKGKPNNGGC